MTDEPTTYHNLLELLESNGTEATAYQFGRSLYKYTACGPWIVFLLADGSRVYYEDKRANETDWFAQCVGIQIGSIVEGSDVEVDSEPLMFPFTEEQFDATVKAVDDEADFYWKRDNSTWYSVRDASGAALFFCQWIAWNDEPDCGCEESQKDLAKAAGEIVNSYEGIITEDMTLPIPNTEFFVRFEETPDITF